MAPSSEVNSCIFCRIVAEKVPCHKVWEDEAHLAFLSIFPNTTGFTVVIPKQHHTSDVFKQSIDTVQKLMTAAQKVAQRLEQVLEKVGRVALVFEGLGVNHLHAKLIPLYGTSDKWEAIHPLNPPQTFYTTYPGYLSTHDAERASDKALAQLSEQLLKVPLP